MKVVPDLLRCTGCRTCEVACAFHHIKSFGRSKSSIRVKRFERWGSFEISFVKGSENGTPCDGCVNEKVPYCLRFCPVGALKVG